MTKKKKQSKSFDWFFSWLDSGFNPSPLVWYERQIERNEIEIMDHVGPFVEISLGSALHMIVHEDILYQVCQWAHNDPLRRMLEMYYGSFHAWSQIEKLLIFEGCGPRKNDENFISGIMALSDQKLPQNMKTRIIDAIGNIET